MERYSDAELRGLDFDGQAPDPARLSQRWRAALEVARETVAILPAEEVGRAVLDPGGAPFRETPNRLRDALARRELLFHEGSIRGALPRIVR